MTRKFLIQRYASEMHDRIIGREPFFVKGPNFKRYIICNNSIKFRDELISLISSGIDRDSLSLSLICEGIVSPAWSDISDLSLDEKIFSSIVYLSRNIHDDPSWFLCLLGSIDSEAKFLVDDGISISIIEDKCFKL